MDAPISLLRLKLFSMDNSRYPHKIQNPLPRQVQLMIAMDAKMTVLYQHSQLNAELPVFFSATGDFRKCPWQPALSFSSSLAVEFCGCGQSANARNNSRYNCITTKKSKRYRNCSWYTSGYLVRIAKLFRSHIACATLMCVCVPCLCGSVRSTDGV